jgi:hypothetical protein
LLDSPALNCRCIFLPRTIPFRKFRSRHEGPFSGQELVERRQPYLILAPQFDGYVDAFLGIGWR